MRIIWLRDSWINTSKDKINSELTLHNIEVLIRSDNWKRKYPSICYSTPPREVGYKVRVPLFVEF